MTTETECQSYCSECRAPLPDHYEECSQHGRIAAAAILGGYDYSHLIGDPGVLHRKVVDVTLEVPQFKELLTDYDRILLSFGMHISLE